MSCAYQLDKVVLTVKNFFLQKGEIVFLLGPSGIGKSTFIEAIGLINNTGNVEAGTKAVYLDDRSESTDLIRIWDQPLSTLENFRRDHFSFIFQNNYLMPNLTAGENMMLTLLMKGEKENQAKNTIIKYMEIVNLSKEFFDKKIYNLSGGQKQRLAFVRAIASPFEILIGDEPTGNLDAVTARSLMTFTRTSIKEKNKVGIFVSHDIQLALDFADRICLIKPLQTNSGYIGSLSDDSTLVKTDENWCLHSEDISAPYDYIYNIYQEVM